MSLTILIAGCSKDERERIETSVRAAFGEHAQTSEWNVSLVGISNQWSIEIDGPEPHYKGLSLVAGRDEVGRSLKRVLEEAGSQLPAVSPGTGLQVSTPLASPPQVSKQGTVEQPKTDRHRCEGCEAGFEVLYHASPNELEELCPVACPSCWHVNNVPVAASAGLTGDYRARSTG